MGFKITGYQGAKTVRSEYKKKKCVTVKNEMYEQAADLIPSNSHIFHKGESVYIVMDTDSGDYSLWHTSSFSISRPVLTLSKDHKIESRRFLSETINIPTDLVAAVLMVGLHFLDMAHMLIQWVFVRFLVRILQ